jgi:5,5'-dehydrodivanillate O-demethylase
VRLLGTAIIPCNWLQIMENSVDSIHTEWLHGAFYEWVRTSRGAPESVAISKHHVKIGFDEFPYGIIKRRVLDGHTEDDDDWKVGHPLVFPNALANGGASDNWREYRFQFRVPVDDTNTLHLWYTAYIPPYGRTAPAHLRDRVHVYDVPFKDEAGNFLIETIHGQDIMAWVTQGPIADRTREALNSTDRGITMYRRMLQRELELHESGGDPKMVIRKPEDDVLIQIPLERMKAHRADGFECIYRRHQVSYSDVFEDIVRLYADPVSV